MRLIRAVLAGVALRNGAADKPKLDPTKPAPAMLKPPPWHIQQAAAMQQKAAENPAWGGELIFLLLPSSDLKEES